MVLSAAVSQSPSLWTISGAFEPSSRLTFLCGTLLRIPQPTGAEPVKVRARVSSCSTIALPTSEPGPGITLSQPCGQPRLEQDLGQLDRGDRRLPGGLEDDRVAGRDRRPELVGDEVEGEVEGADRADHPVGDPQHHPELAGARRRGLHRHRAAGQLARLDRGEGEGLGAAAGLDRRRLQRLAGLGGDRQRQVLESVRRRSRRRGRGPRPARAGGSRRRRRPPAPRGRPCRRAPRRPGRPCRRRCRRTGSEPHPTRLSPSTRRRRGACDRPPGPSVSPSRTSSGSSVSD